MGTITRNFANNILGTGEVDATDGVNGTISATNVADASLNNVTSLPSSVGYAVKSVASDPPSLNAGEIFYNSTAGAFKALVNVEAWSSGSSIGTGRYGAASLGSQTANLFCGGSTLPFGTQTICEEYNGSGWATAGGLGTTRYMLQGAGTVSAGLVFGGNYPARKNETEEYNGTTWSEQNNLNTARRLPGGSGTQTDALAIAGDDGGPGGALVTSVVEEYNGTSWTEVNNVPTAVRGGCAIGNSTPVSMFFGGYTGTERIGTTVEYDGTNWTAGGNMVNGGNEMMGSGTQTAGLTFGGTRPGVTTATEKYDGTSWTTAPATLATAVYAQGGSGPAGTSSAALNTSGRTPSSPAGTKLGTEEFNSSTNTITAAAWASGGALGTVRNVLAGAGIQTAALMIGGNNPGTTQKGNVEEYDGSSYSEINDLTTARSQGGSAGTSTAALFFGGDVYPASPRDTAKTEEYNGSSWSEQNDMVGTARRALIGFGTQTAAVGAAGYGGGILALTEEYNGTSWTAGNAMPVAKESLAAGGSQTAGLTFGGRAPPGPAVVKTTEEYDGTNWTSGGSLNTGRWGLGRGTVGSQTACLGFGGDSSSPSVQSATENYDGTTWSTRSNMATARRASGGAGTPTAALCSGGYSSTNVNTTEEFTGETITQVAKTLSSS